MSESLSWSDIVVFIIICIICGIWSCCEEHCNDEPKAIYSAPIAVTGESHQTSDKTDSTHNSDSTCVSQPMPNQQDQRTNSNVPPYPLGNSYMPMPPTIQQGYQPMFPTVPAGTTINFTQPPANVPYPTTNDTQIMMDPPTFEEAMPGDSLYSKQPAFNPAFKSS